MSASANELPVTDSPSSSSATRATVPTNKEGPRFWRDLFSALSLHDSWAFMAWIDIRLRYRRTTLGPFWMVIVSFISIICIALLGSLLFRVKFSDFFPYVAAGMVIWQYISLTLTESCQVYITQIGLIKNINVSLISFCLRMYMRNTIVFAHSLIVVSLVLLWYHTPLNWSILYFIPGLLVYGINSVSVAIMLGFLCTRFRDVMQLIQALIGILAFMTPIMWQPEMLGEKAYLAYWNPLTHFIDLLRQPLLGLAPSMQAWYVTLGISAINLLIAASVYNAFKKRLVYWL